MTWELLTPAQRAATERVLAEERRARRHIVVSVSGAHAYGFASPDSDVDVKAVHVEATDRLLGLRVPVPHAERLEIVDGVEIDYSSNEIHPVLVGALAGNGNFLERLLGPCALEAAPPLAALRPLLVRVLSRRVHRHYRGFAGSQLRELVRAPTAKKALYVLRTALTGAHLLRTGEMAIDVRPNLGRYGFAEAEELLEHKRTAERAALAPPVAERWAAELGRVFTVLEEALAQSPLPEDPPEAAAADLEAWLVELRRGALA